MNWRASIVIGTVIGLLIVILGWAIDQSKSVGQVEIANGYTCHVSKGGSVFGCEKDS